MDSKKGALVLALTSGLSFVPLASFATAQTSALLSEPWQSAESPQPSDGSTEPYVTRFFMSTDTVPLWALLGFALFLLGFLAERKRKDPQIDDG